VRGKIISVNQRSSALRVFGVVRGLPARNSRNENLRPSSNVSTVAVTSNFE
jgi:hypothetical protein